MSLDLNNPENYKYSIENTTPELFVKYKGLIQEYLVQCIDIIYMSDIVYYRYILCKGIKILTHVFSLLLLYTNNIDLTYSYSQKSLYYYVEFIGQIGHENNSFLELNSKDAAMFVYKKSINEVNREFVKSNTNECETKIKLTNLGILIDLHSKYVSDIVNVEFNDSSKKTILINTIEGKLSKLSQNLLNLSLVEDEREYGKLLNMIHLVDHKVYRDGVNVILILEAFTRKIRSKKINQSLFEEKLFNAEHDTILTNYSNLRYVNWLLSDSKN